MPICGRLACIFNASWSSGTVPSEWKVSRVTPMGGVSGRNIVCKAFSKMDQLVGVGSIDEGALCGCALRSGMAK